jgi:hypothetical protein
MRSKADVRQRLWFCGFNTGAITWSFPAIPLRGPQRLLLSSGGRSPLPTSVWAQYVYRRKISDLVWSFAVPNCSAAKQNIERTVCYHFATQLFGTDRYGKRYRGSED